MLKTIAIMTLTVILMAGCQEKISSGKNEVKSSTRNFDLLKFLNAQNLPTIETVETWENKIGSGLKIQTDHYEIFTTLKDPLMLTDVPAFLENCQSNFQKLFSKSPAETERFKMYLFDNRTQWQNFTAGFAGREYQIYSQIKAGAYYSNGCCVAYNIGRERTFYALGHECWHQFADKNFKFSLPSWLNEGLAMQFEANFYKDGLFYFVPGDNFYRIDMLKKAIEKNQIIPLETLLRSEPGALFGDEQKISAFYSQCYALVLFLQDANGGKRREDFKRLLSDGMNGKWNLTGKDRIIAVDRSESLTEEWNKRVGPEIFRQYFGSDINSIEIEYIDFCRDLARKNIKRYDR
jgi:hypothetical protein